MEEELRRDPKATQCYKLKDGGKVRMNKGIAMLTPEQLVRFKEAAKDILCFFDYVEREGNPTGFYDLGLNGDSSVEMGGFRSLNAEALKDCLDPSFNKHFKWNSDKTSM